MGLVASGLASCVVSTGPPGLDAHYLGYIRLAAPAAESGGRLDQITMLGAWFEADKASGGGTRTGVGFRRTERVEVPMDCRLAVIVRNESELAQARVLAATVEGGGACAIDATD